MAYDEAKIQVKSGDGGNGIVHFRREKYVPRGGPAGGDGGKGGDVALVVEPTLNTLLAFTQQKYFPAENGQHGGTSNRTGRSGADLDIPVPPGTIVRDAQTGELIADLIEPGQRVVVARGGRGGRGNARFATSTNQAPRIAEKGEPGEQRALALELRLLADVGIVGVPNAGKSTLLSVVSNAKPKIADYPFTTLEPNLGVARIDDRDLVLADIPGLIEGAHLGVGLGHGFLRHIQRTRVLIHLLDGAADDPLADFHQINSELALFDEALAAKPQIVALNKIDLPQAQERWPDIRDALKRLGYEPMAISAATHQNVRDLLGRTLNALDALPDIEEPAERPLYSLGEDPLAFEIRRQPDGSFRVSGKRIERAAAMTYWDYDQAAARFQRILETMGVSEALREAGIQPGDTVFIGDTELEWGE
ncbi:MAG TPA: GTPase ObgE [Aggregatilineaceae bacterium]|nr:GTPase ObgE [Anaerolineae bacterium]HMM27702.1 GTPase ObgE [Aggregatilineaceae bacterium]